MKKYYCFSANRICHHDDYYLLIKSLISDNDNYVKNEKKILNKLKILLSRNKIIYFDIDKYDLIFSPLIILRSLYAEKSVAISVRTERLMNYQIKSFYDRCVLITKRLLFRLITAFSNTTILSTHKDARGKNTLNNYVNDFIFDPQYWDLKYLNPKTSVCEELSNKAIDLTKSILLPGRFNRQKSINEFLESLDSNKDITFIIAGPVDEIYFNELIKHKNIIIINKFLPNDQLLYLLKNIKYTYCYYPLDFDRPSGFFGRALQYGNKVLVRKNSYLDKEFGDYKNVISLNSLNQINSSINLVEKMKLNVSNIKFVDDSKKIVNYLLD